jgi:hypothetical protein
VPKTLDGTHSTHGTNSTQTGACDVPAEGTVAGLTKGSASAANATRERVQRIFDALRVSRECWDGCFRP